MEIIRENERLAAANAAFLAMPPVENALPIRFPQGGELQVVASVCSKCGTEFLPNDLRMRAVRLTPTLVTFDGWGACRACSLLHKVTIRIRGHAHGQFALEWHDAERGWLSSRFDLSKWQRMLRLFNPRYIKRWLGQSPKAGLYDALSKASGRAARDIISSGWTDALEVEFTALGYSRLRAAGEDTDEAVSFVSINGQRLRLALGAWHLGPKAREFGPVHYEVEDLQTV